MGCAVWEDAKSLIILQSSKLCFVFLCSDVKTPVENLETSIDEADAEPEEKKKEREDLCKQNAQLMQDRLNLVRRIMLEHEKCINLRVQLGLHQVAESK